MRSILKDKKAAKGLLAAVVMLIAVMMAAIIGAVVFFAFGDSVADSAATSDASFTDTISGSADVYISLSAEPGDTPAYDVTVTNATATRTLSTGYTYQSGNQTLKIASAQLEAADTQIDVTFNTRAYDSTNSVITYAITVFGLIAIVPLILVGSLMLKSIGLWSGKDLF